MLITPPKTNPQFGSITSNATSEEMENQVPTTDIISAISNDDQPEKKSDVTKLMSKKVSNVYNETSMLSAVKGNLSSLFQKKLAQSLEDNTAN